MRDYGPWEANWVSEWRGMGGGGNQVMGIRRACVVMRAPDELLSTTSKTNDGLASPAPHGIRTEKVVIYFLNL